MDQSWLAGVCCTKDWTWIVKCTGSNIFRETQYGSQDRFPEMFYEYRRDVRLRSLRVCNNIIA
jgi:hypothetical protein